VTNGALLERWLEEVLATPGLTGLDSIEAARAVLLHDALRALPLLAEHGGDVLDIGSGGGSPGIPLAASLPDRRFTLLEAERRKADALVHLARDLPNVEAVWGRAEEQPVELYGVALAKALAKPPVAAELTLPLVRRRGAAILWVGRSADRDHVARVARALGGELEQEHDGLLVLRKTGPTPAGFPRRSGMAKKRPLA
jgi:16S rRNA (guanine527-N7)-methyltransferase